MEQKDKHERELPQKINTSKAMWIALKNGSVTMNRTMFALKMNVQSSVWIDKLFLSKQYTQDTSQSENLKKVRKTPWM
jgi:hypothetical protein